MKELSHCESTDCPQTYSTDESSVRSLAGLAWAAVRAEERDHTCSEDLLLTGSREELPAAGKT